MKSCPTCKAKYKGESKCYRCKSDLTILLAIEKEAAYHLHRAKYYAKEKKYDKTLFEVKRSISLLKTEEAESLKNYILALQGDFSGIISSLSDEESIEEESRNRNTV